MSKPKMLGHIVDTKPHASEIEKNKWNEEVVIIDSLDSTSKTEALSANQGNVIKINEDKIKRDIVNLGGNIDSLSAYVLETAHALDDYKMVNNTRVGDLIQVGAIVKVATGSPSFSGKWLKCDGASMLIESLPELYSVIGHAYTPRFTSPYVVTDTLDPVFRNPGRGIHFDKNTGVIYTPHNGYINAAGTLTVYASSDIGKSVYSTGFDVADGMGVSSIAIGYDGDVVIGVGSAKNTESLGGTVIFSDDGCFTYANTGISCFGDPIVFFINDIFIMLARLTRAYVFTVHSSSNGKSFTRHNVTISSTTYHFEIAHNGEKYCIVDTYRLFLIANDFSSIVEIGVPVMVPITVHACNMSNPNSIVCVNGDIYHYNTIDKKLYCSKSWTSVSANLLFTGNDALKTLWRMSAISDNIIGIGGDYAESGAVFKLVDIKLGVFLPEQIPCYGYCGDFVSLDGNLFYMGTTGTPAHADMLDTIDISETFNVPNIAYDGGFSYIKALW